MGRLSRLCTSFCTLACIVFLCSTCSGQTPDRTKHAGQFREVKPVGELVPLIDYALPYRGVGAVRIMGDGTLQIGIGGHEGIDLTSGQPFFDGETITYHLDTADLTVVVSGEEVFLDKIGQQIRERGLNDQQVSITRFTGKANHLSDPLVELTGQLDLSFDATTDELSFTLIDTVSSGQFFSLSAPVRLTTTKTLEEMTVRNAKSNRTTKTGRSFGEPMEINLLLLLGSSCSIDCPNGSSSITCLNSGCKCTCENGNPVCICTFLTSSAE